MTTPLRRRLNAAFPAGELLRYLVVGACNTLFGTGLFVAVLYLLNRFAPSHILSLAVTQARLAIAANILSTPINITVSYLNYKLFVFRTRGNYIREWLKAFGVYGVSNLVGLLALGALTRTVEILLHGATPLGKGTPGYIAGVSLTVVTTAISYIGHKKVTFGGSPGHDEELAVETVFPSPEE